MISSNNKPMYGYMLPNLSPSTYLYKVLSVYNNDVYTFVTLIRETKERLYSYMIMVIM